MNDQRFYGLYGFIAHLRSPARRSQSCGRVAKVTGLNPRDDEHFLWATYGVNALHASVRARMPHVTVALTVTRDRETTRRRRTSSHGWMVAP